MKDRLAVICAYNPTRTLISTVAHIKLFYDEFDIVIIDSDSTNTDVYKLLPDNCTVEYCKNKNYELGAWTYAFNKYNQYSVFMFLQDSLTPNRRIPNFDKLSYENGTIYTFNYMARICDGGYFEDLVNVYKNTDLQFISDLDPNTWILCNAHTCFILNKEHVPFMLQLENAYIDKKLQKSKIDLWLSERTGGIMADKLPKRINVEEYFTKVHGGRV